MEKGRSRKKKKSEIDIKALVAGAITDLIVGIIILMIDKYLL